MPRPHHLNLLDIAEQTMIANGFDPEFPDAPIAKPATETDATTIDSPGEVGHTGTNDTEYCA